MAKRKRLTPAQAGFAAPSPAPASARPPIAQVAGAAAAQSALGEMRAEWDKARADGRLVLSLPLAAVQAEHLIRDRAALDDEAQAALVASLRARGQQTPIEVVELAAGQYGLISGWRRLTALRALFAETQEARFAEVQALIRCPEDRAAAYIAMVEENEIRADLSLYERARITRKALEAGVFDSEKAALHGLFGAVSYAKRSKIKTLIPVVGALDGGLRFPGALPERLGLDLARALEADPDLAARLRADLAAADAQEASAERAVLERALRAYERPAETASVVDDPAPEPPAPAETADSIAVKTSAYRVELTGLGVTPAFTAELRAWLKSRA